MSKAQASAVGDDSEGMLGELNALRAQGADKAEPVRFHFLETLARRLETQQGAARQALEIRLAQGLDELRQRMETRRVQAEAAATAAVERFPQAADNLKRLVETGDAGALRRTVARLNRTDKPSPLKELTALLSEPAALTTSTETNSAPPSASAPAPVPVAVTDIADQADLKSVRYFRDTWSRLAVDQRVNQALEQEPENAGPLNSHLLILRALKLMRDTAPDYLTRFMSYADTLLWLDAVNSIAQAPKSATASDEPRKKKTSRAKAR